MEIQSISGHLHPEADQIPTVVHLTNTPGTPPTLTLHREPVAADSFDFTGTGGTVSAVDTARHLQATFTGTYTDKKSTVLNCTCTITWTLIGTRPVLCIFQIDDSAGNLVHAITNTHFMQFLPTEDPITGLAIGKTVPVTHTDGTDTGSLTVLSVISNDDSVKVTVSTCPDAVDYRVINLADPTCVKYAGGPNPTIEVNGIDPINGADLFIESVGALGPFQDLDPLLPMPADNMSQVLNGHGDPKNMPMPCCATGVFHVACTPRKLTGTQVFFDNFQNPKPLVKQPADAELAKLHTISGHALHEAYSNDKWDIHLFDHDSGKTRLFFMDSHFMDILYDYHGTMRGKMVMVPKVTPTLKTGDVLHVSFEVDAYLSLNRTVGMLVLPAADKLLYPMAGQVYTMAGNIFDWDIASDAHRVGVWANAVNHSVTSKAVNPPRWHGTGRSTFGGGLNGGETDLDKRHRFDLYLSSTRYQIYEEGQLQNEVDLTKVFVKGMPLLDSRLPWLTAAPVKIAFYHYLYHSTADHVYLQRGEMTPRPDYWLDRRPDSDFRHWDSIGLEVLAAFPALVGGM